MILVKHNKQPTKNYEKLVIYVAVFCLILLSYSWTASAQEKGLFKPQDNMVEMLEVSPSASIPVKKMMYRALREKIDKYKDYYGGVSPYLYYAFVDINGDGRNEIVIQFHEEYDFRDRFGNVDTHIFTMTKEGPKEILSTKAYGLGIPITGPNNRIYLDVRPYTRRYKIYEYNGTAPMSEVQ